MDFDWSIVLSQLTIFLDLLLSALLGFMIGFERKLRFKEAGIRTHTVVCIGSALMMIVSKNAFDHTADSARVAAQIVSGVGFLGAGMIVYRGNEVRGLTTAAGVWATAGVGMACGGGLHVLAVCAAILIIVLQSLFHLPCRVFRSKRFYSVKIEFLQMGDENRIIKEIFGTDRFNHLVLTRDSDRVVYSATLTTDVEFSSKFLNEVMQENPFILSIERCDNE